MVEDSQGGQAIQIEIDSPEDFGTRIDRLVTRELAKQGYELSRSQLARSFEQKRVLVEGLAVKASFRPEKPTSVEVQLVAAPPLARAFPEDLPLDLLYEDEDLLVVDKAAGMVVHAGAGHERGTLVNAVLHHLSVDAKALPVLAGNGPERPGVVHRLDKDTSGVMIMAKNAPAQTFLAEQFRVHSIERQYLAICRGSVSFSKQRVQSQHGRDSQDRRRFVPRGTRRAISNFYCLCKGELASVLACRLETGRTHQIRMHAKALGHPLLSDTLYAGRPRHPKLAPIENALGRQALHAHTLAFVHPSSKERMHFESAIPDDFCEALRALGMDPKSLKFPQ